MYKADATAQDGADISDVVGEGPAYEGGAQTAKDVGHITRTKVPRPQTETKKRRVRLEDSLRPKDVATYLENGETQTLDYAQKRFEEIGVAQYKNDLVKSIVSLVNHIRNKTPKKTIKGYAKELSDIQTSYRNAVTEINKGVFSLEGELNECERNFWELKYDMEEAKELVNSNQETIDDLEGLKQGFYSKTEAELAPIFEMYGKDIKENSKLDGMAKKSALFSRLQSKASDASKEIRGLVLDYQEAKLAANQYANQSRALKKAVELAEAHVKTIVSEVGPEINKIRTATQMTNYSLDFNGVYDRLNSFLDRIAIIGDDVKAYQKVMSNKQGEIKKPEQSSPQGSEIDQEDPAEALKQKADESYSKLEIEMEQDEEFMQSLSRRNAELSSLLV